MSYSSHNDNAKFGAVLSGLALVGYGLFRALEWVVLHTHCLFESF